MEKSIGQSSHQQALALQQINLRIDAQNDRLTRIEDTIEQQQQQLDFVVRGNEKPEELLILGNMHLLSMCRCRTLFTTAI
jgi:hypothetical protein